MFKIAVVGATGLVGQKMIRVLEEREFPVQELVPLASPRSEGGTVEFQGRRYEIARLSEGALQGVRLALFSAGSDVSREFAPRVVEMGGIVIDNSSYWRMNSGVPLIVPEVNAQELKAHRGIIANPNCSTIQLVVAVHLLHRRFRIQRIVVSTYQAVSGAGEKGIAQLKEELSGQESGDPIFPHPIALNCIPQIDEFSDDGYTGEEWKMIRETQKILGDSSVKITATAVRVPVLGGHSEAVNIEFAKPFEMEEIVSLLQKSPGVVVLDDPGQQRYPMPALAWNKDEVFVGRIRRDPTVANGIHLWIVSDNLRKGAATNAVQIAEKLIEMKLI